MPKRELFQRMDLLAKELTQQELLTPEGEIVDDKKKKFLQATTLIKGKGKELIDLLDQDDWDEEEVNSIVKKMRLIHGLTNGEMYETLFLWDHRERWKKQTQEKESSHHEADMILHTREAEQLQKMLKKHTKKAIDQLKDEVFKSVGKASVLHDLIKESGKFEK